MTFLNFERLNSKGLKKMKNVMRFILFVSLILIGALACAQEVKINDAIYEVKKDLIFEKGVDVTNSISNAKKLEIFEALEKKKLEMAEAKASNDKLEKVAKAQERAEKQQKKAEKKQKQAEKALERMAKAQANYDKAISKHKAALKKYEKLKNKGKLSPVDEQKWLDKIEKLNSNIAKMKKKMK